MTHESLPDAWTLRLVNTWEATVECENGRAMGTGRTRREAIRNAWGYHQPGHGAVKRLCVIPPMSLERAREHVAIIQGIAAELFGEEP